MSVVWEGFLQGINGVKTVALVVIPLMIFLEIAQANGLLQKLNRVLARAFKYIGLSEEGAFPILVAMIFGLTFGSGVIISHVRTGKVNDNEVKIVGTFISIAHALIEDTIIFLTLGAPLLLLILPRIFVAYVLAYFVYRHVIKERINPGESHRSC